MRVRRGTAMLNLFKNPWIDAVARLNSCYFSDGEQWKARCLQAAGRAALTFSFAAPLGWCWWAEGGESR